MAARFLTAEWLHVVFLNYPIDPRTLRNLVPSGTELDDWQGQTFVSLVGFLFRNTRIWGMAIPFHRHFEEVNLRFYVRRKTGNQWRRGVVFIKELAPRRAIAWTARALCGENYATVPLTHQIQNQDGDSRQPYQVEYSWKYGNHSYSLSASAMGQPCDIEAGSQDEFIISQAWGYSGGTGRATIEYRVDHRPWRVWRPQRARFSGDAAMLYGDAFADVLVLPPQSTALVDGSEVTVYRGIRLEPSAP